MMEVGRTLPILYAQCGGTLRPVLYMKLRGEEEVSNFLYRKRMQDSHKKSVTVSLRFWEVDLLMPTVISTLTKKVHIPSGPTLEALVQRTLDGM